MVCAGEKGVADDAEGIANIQLPGEVASPAGLARGSEPRTSLQQQDKTLVTVWKSPGICIRKKAIPWGCADCIGNPRLEFRVGEDVESLVLRGSARLVLSVRLVTPSSVKNGTGA